MTMLILSKVFQIHHRLASAVQGDRVRYHEINFKDETKN